MGAASCSQNVEETDLGATATNQIGFMTNTTRADVVTIDDLKDDGFVVYGMRSSDTGSWDDEMNDSNSYVFGTDWGWSGAKPTWPEEGSSDYPIYFYAYYYDAAAGGVSIDDSSVGNLVATYAPPTNGQTDIVTATSTATVRPVGDRLPLIFKHILSKVNFTITTGTGVVTHTQAVGFNNICNERDYLVADEDWDDQEADALGNYAYLETQNTAYSSANGDFAGTYGNLMMLPQSTTSWQPAADLATVTGSHIYLIYRAEMGDDKNAIGYEDAANHPNFSSTRDKDLAGTPLFVKVGYPLGDSTFDLVAGQSYNYDINLGVAGATNGYLIDENYYDEDGNRTELPVEGLDINDPITSGYINFTVSVEEWTNDSGVDML